MTKRDPRSVKRTRPGVPAQTLMLQARSKIERDYGLREPEMRLLDGVLEGLREADLDAHMGSAAARRASEQSIEIAAGRSVYTVALELQETAIRRHG